MDDPVGVPEREPRRHPPEQARCLGPGDGPVDQQHVQRSAVHERHEQGRAAADVEHVQHGQDVRVLQPSLHPAFVEEPRPQPGARDAQDLQRAPGAQHLVDDPPDLAASANPQEGLHGIAVDDRATSEHGAN